MRLINCREAIKLPVGTLFVNINKPADLCRVIGRDKYIKFKIRDRETLESSPSDQVYSFGKTYGRTPKLTLNVYEPCDYDELISKFSAFIHESIKISPFAQEEVSPTEKLSQLIGATKFAALLDVSLATLRKMQERDTNFPIAIQLTPDTIRYREADIANYIRSLKVPK